MPITKTNAKFYINDIFENQKRSSETLKLQIAVKRRIFLIMNLSADFHLQSLGNFKILNPKDDKPLLLSHESIKINIPDEITLNYRCIFFTHEDYSEISPNSEKSLEGIAISTSGESFHFIELTCKYSEEIITVDISCNAHLKRCLEDCRLIYDRLGSLIEKWRNITRKKLKLIERAYKLKFVEDQELCKDDQIREENAFKLLEE